MRQWRLIESGVGGAAWNMAIDEALLRTFSEGDRPLLRLYRWEPSLTLGRFQKSGESIDKERAERLGIPSVRRMTGGGTLVHGGDLSYALVLPRSYTHERGVKESYRRLCAFLLRLYGRLGLKAHFARDAGFSESPSASCLAGREAYDIIINGAKMGGNAQRYTRHALFQHGSIPLEIDAQRFAPLFRSVSGLSEAATLSRLGVVLDYDDVAATVREAFQESFDAELLPDTLSGGEERTAIELLERKYGTKEWNDEARSPMA